VADMLINGLSINEH